MLRVPLNKAHMQRTLRVNYGWTQATPKDVFLHPAWDRSVDIYPGMVAMHVDGEQYTLIDGTGTPAGLFGEYIGGDGIDEVAERGVNATAVWVLGPDAEFEVLAPAFDTEETWEVNGDGTPTLVYASTTGDNRGKLVPEGGTGAGSQPVARLLKVVSPTEIIIGGLHATDAAPAAPAGG